MKLPLRPHRHECTGMPDGPCYCAAADTSASDALPSWRNCFSVDSDVSADACSAFAVTSSISSIPDAKILTGSEKTDAWTSPGILSAEANARGKLERARGDAGYTWRPIITFGAQYGRVSPINNVSSFYNLHGNYNTANIGVQLEFPMLDRVRKAAARVSMLDALHASSELNDQKLQQSENRRKLQRSIRTMNLKAQMAELDYEIAETELRSTTTQLHASGGNPPLTPKEEQNAKMQTEQKLLDLLDTRLQLSKAKLSLLRQTGQLDHWLHGVVISSSNP